MRRPSIPNADYTNRLLRVGDYSRLAHEFVRAGDQLRTQAVLERLDLEGLLTNRLLDDLLTLPGVRPYIAAQLRSQRVVARGTLPSMIGSVWTLIVPQTDTFTGLDGQRIAIPCMVNCFVSAGQTVPMTTIRTWVWSERGASLSHVLFAVDRAVCDFSPGARPGWSRGRTRCDLRFLGEPLALKEADRSHELAVSLAVISAALDVELEPGTVAFGRVCTLPEEARALRCDLGTVLPLGNDSIWLKLAGMIHSLPIAAKVYCSFYESEFLRAHLPEDRREVIEIIPLANIQDIPRLIGADPSRFRGHRRPSRWSSLLQFGRDLSDWGVTPLHAVQREMSIRRDEARARFGRILGEQCAVPSFLSAAMFASVLSSSWRLKSFFVILLFCPVVFVIARAVSLRILGIHHLGERLAVRAPYIEEQAAAEVKEQRSIQATTRVTSPDSELRTHVGGMFVLWMIWLACASALWGRSVFDGSGWRAATLLMFLFILGLAAPMHESAARRFLAFDFPTLHAFRLRWAWFGFVTWIACLFSPTREGLAVGAALVSVYLFLVPRRLLSRRTPRMIATQMYRSLRSRRAAALFLLVAALVPSLDSPIWLASAWSHVQIAMDALQIEHRLGIAAFFGLVGLLRYRRGLIDYSEHLAPDPVEIMLRSQDGAGKLKGGFPAIDPLLAHQGLRPSSQASPNLEGQGA